VPLEAVVGRGDVGAVFVVADGRVERRSVRLGVRSGAEQFVESGLVAGTQVVVGGLDALADGMRVRVAR
jgi:HlyD family secretion protein